MRFLFRAEPEALKENRPFKLWSSYGPAGDMLADGSVGSSTTYDAEDRERAQPILVRILRSSPGIRSISALPTLDYALFSL